MMSSNRTIVKLKRALKERSFPTDIEKFLVSSGFDCESAILGINKEIIKEIELFVNDNKHLLEHTSYETVLRNNTVFKFKPGHKSILLLLPKSLSEYNAKKNHKKDPTLFEKEEEDDETEKENFDEQLKEKLVQKLINFTRKHFFEIVLDKSLIRNYINENNKPICHFECPICNCPIKCYYTRYWNVSNLEKHLKNHFKIATVEIVPISTLSNRRIIHHNSSELDEVLSD